tara:strand:- start:161 stop:511 length:351 start_codon:yes stop_codon:yes gene_type:complete
VGVSNNPNPVSFVRGTDASSWNKGREDFVLFILQRRAHLVEYHAFVPTSKPANVLCHDPSGANLSDNSEHFRPEMSIVGSAFSLSDHGERLTRKSATEDVDSPCPRESIELFDVFI